MKAAPYKLGDKTMSKLFDEQLRRALKLEPEEEFPPRQDCIAADDLANFYDEGARHRQASQIRAHLADCAFCRSSLSDIRQMTLLRDAGSATEKRAAVPPQKRFGSWLSFPWPEITGFTQLTAVAALLIIGFMAWSSSQEVRRVQGRESASQTQVLALQREKIELQRTLNETKSRLAKASSGSDVRGVSPATKPSATPSPLMAKGIPISPPIDSPQVIALREKAQTFASALARADAEAATRRKENDGLRSKQQDAERLLLAANESNAPQRPEMVLNRPFSIPALPTVPGDNETFVRAGDDEIEWLTPANPYVAEKAPVFKWKPVDTPEEYTVYIKNLKTGKLVTVRTSEPQYTLTTSEVGGRYEIQVKAAKADKPGAFWQSQTRVFTIMSSEQAEQAKKARRLALELFRQYAVVGMIDDARRVLTTIPVNDPAYAAAQELLKRLEDKTKSQSSKK